MRGKKSNEDNIFKDPNMVYHWVSFSLPQQTMTLFLPFYYLGGLRVIRMAGCCPGNSLGLRNNRSKVTQVGKLRGHRMWLSLTPYLLLPLASSPS